MGDVVARKDWTDYRVGPGGEELYPFDEANPPVVPLGVDGFGQSGARADLYRHYEIDTDAIVAAAYRALDLRGG